MKTAMKKPMPKANPAAPKGMKMDKGDVMVKGKAFEPMTKGKKG
jgi:hypothetical protein